MRSQARNACLLLAVMSVFPAGGCSWFRGKESGPVRVPAGSFYQPAVGVTTPEVAAGEPATDAVPTTVPVAPALVPSLTANPIASGEASGVSVTDAAAGPSVVSPRESLSERLLIVPPTPVVATADRKPVLESPTTKPVVSVGSYMTMGGVLAEVNGVPIFAAKVMKAIEPILATRAKELTAPQFELQAKQLIDKQVGEFIRDELYYAAAQRNTGPEERKIADYLTTEWRERQIRAAGGSIEQAKRVAAENGDDFDQLVDGQNRQYLVMIFREKKINPRIAYTTADQRKYYKDNVDKLFTDRTQANFRMIRVDPAKQGGKDKALEKIRAVRERAVGGEDFAKLATEVNDDASMARRGGLVGMIDKGNFALEKVEEAVFRTEEGQVTEIVEDRGGFYIAKVEFRKLGNVKAFDDPAVQEAVRNELYRIQMMQLQDQYIAELQKGAIIRRDERMLQTAVEMANQRYAAWRQG